MSHFPRGRDQYGVIHYVHENQGPWRTRDPWCLREVNPHSYGEHGRVERVPPYTPVTCILCIGLRAKR